MTAKQTKLEDNGVEHEKTTKENGMRPGKQCAPLKTRTKTVCMSISQQMKQCS